MGVRFTRGKKYRTETLVSDDEKWERLDRLLDGKIRRQATVFQPDDTFYSLSLAKMAQAMLDFMGIRLGKDELYIQLSNEIEPPGLYFEHEGAHYIYIKQSHANNVLECAAILSHELMHYVLIGGLNYRLEGRLDNEQLTDMATVYAGLGVVVLNGFDHEGNNWIITAAALLTGVIRYSSKSLSFGYYKPQEYGQLLGDYIDDNKIPVADYQSFVMPGAAHFLPAHLKAVVAKAESRTAIVSRVRGAKRKNAVVSTVVGLVIFGLIAFGRGAIGGNSGVSDQVQQEASSLKAAVDAAKAQCNCSGRLALRV